MTRTSPTPPTLTPSTESDSRPDVRRSLPRRVHASRTRSTSGLGLLPLCLCVALLEESTAAQGYWNPLPSVQPGRASDVSDDGSVVVGRGAMATGSSRVFRWTAAGGTQDIAPQASSSVSYLGPLVSADGSTVVGHLLDPNSSTGGLFAAAFAWSAAFGVRDVSSQLPWGTSMTVVAVSDDGSVVVGSAHSGAGAPVEPFTWQPSNGTIVRLSGPSATYTDVRAIDADASVHFGRWKDAGDRWRLYRWTAGTGFVDLGNLGGPDIDVVDVSDDGATVIGNGTTPAGMVHPFVWTAARGLVDVGTNGGLHAWFSGLSRDGQTALGVSNDGAGAARLFRWVSGTGVQDLGTPAPPGAGVNVAAVSGDASALCGDHVGGRFRWTLSGGFETTAQLGSDPYPTAMNGDGTVIVGMDLPAATGRPYRWELVGGTYCSANANSTGSPGILALDGSAVLGAQSLALVAHGLPANQVAFFLTSRTQGFLANPGGSQGNLCLGGAIGRFVGPGQVQNSGPLGFVRLDLVLNALPTPLGPVAVQVGETWNFQAWHRDVGAQPTSNFTQGRSVTFR